MGWGGGRTEERSGEGRQGVEGRQYHVHSSSYIELWCTGRSGDWQSTHSLDSIETWEVEECVDQNNLPTEPLRSNGHYYPLVIIHANTAFLSKLNRVESWSASQEWRTALDSSLLVWLIVWLNSGVSARSFAKPNRFCYPPVSLVALSWCWI